MENKHDINITDYEDVKKYYEDFKDLFEKGEKEQSTNRTYNFLDYIWSISYIDKFNSTNRLFICSSFRNTVSC